MIATEWPEPVEIECVDTGLDTPTGGRIALARERLAGQAFCATYADGVADLDLEALVAFHRGHGDLGTVTVVRPRTQFGVAELDPDDRVLGFEEKPRLEHWVNGGFFCFEPGFLDYLAADSVLEQEPLRQPGGRRAAAGLPAHRLLGLHGHLQGRRDAQRPVGRGQGAVGRLGAGRRHRGRCPLAPPWSPADSGSSAPGSAGSCSGAAIGSSRWTGPPARAGPRRWRCWGSRTRSPRSRATFSTPSSCFARWPTTR